MSSVPGRRHLRSARRGELDFPRVTLATYTGDGRLPMPVPHLGTLYLTVSRTLILLCKPSNAILRLSFFLHTSTFSAFEVSYKNALYKSTVIIRSFVRSLQAGGPAVQPTLDPSAQTVVTTGKVIMFTVQYEIGALYDTLFQKTNYLIFLS